MQGKLTYNMARMKLDGEAIYSSTRSDDFTNNWNIEGYVELVLPGADPDPRPGRSSSGVSACSTTVRGRKSRIR
jgi:hypothetical protein